MSSEVGESSFKPRSYTPLTDVAEGDLELTSEQLDLRNAVTSTPLKLKKKGAKDEETAENKNNSALDISEIGPEPGGEDTELSEWEKLRLQCLAKIEEQIEKCCEVGEQQRKSN